MTRFLNLLRRHKILSGVTLATGLAAGGLSAQFTHALWTAPDPKVTSLAEPLSNTGVNVDGHTLDQWIAAGKPAHEYKPVPKTRYKPGESLWVLRHDCFLFKTQEGKVSRAFLGGDGKAGTNTSVYALPDLQIPTRTDGCAVKNHRTPIPHDLPAGIWRYQATVNFYKSAVQPSVRVQFKPVVIDVSP